MVGRGALDFHRQKSRNPLRCHRISVSGFTIVSAARQSISRDEHDERDPRRIIGAAGLDLAFSVERQLLPQKEILRRQLRPRAEAERQRT